ncbi:MAG: hypothetical protein P0Y53_24130 [Candidatus Pseudobacter hemicellulosilyticus]|uniref:Uncharacterized protein n=1 Tax=Candidatus Pseudobacter hemicellulosilyticus TaxID=3121375 RepID=A0AAJ6BFF0_9BACT|nr:MAG: hypothetical protein P0Y53_24130 [Pseudobacter sp.]
MKRIFSVFAVAAIVTSAFAFAKPYGGFFCASLTQNISCAVTGSSFTEVTSGGTIFYKHVGWNGTTADCLSNRCNTQTRFTTE